MSLRAIKMEAFVIACDACGARSATAGLTPVEAELLAASVGWLAQANPLKHRCPTCAPVPPVASHRKEAACPSAS